VLYLFGFVGNFANKEKNQLDKKYNPSPLVFYGTFFSLSFILAIFCYKRSMQILFDSGFFNFIHVFRLSIF
jgi:hypothetical protein